MEREALWTFVFIEHIHIKARNEPYRHVPLGRDMRIHHTLQIEHPPKLNCHPYAVHTNHKKLNTGSVALMRV
jgi:hypothetical protein